MFTCKEYNLHERDIATVDRYRSTKFVTNSEWNTYTVKKFDFIWFTNRFTLCTVQNYDKFLIFGNFLCD